MRAVQVYHTADLVVLRYCWRHPNHVILRYARRRHLLVII
jgi:hypothetical protein